MPGRGFGPGPFFDGGHWWLGLAFTGLSLLLWLGIAALVIWVSLRWIAPRWRALSVSGASGAYVAAQPSAIETLRHRYALGEIDAPTFEQMVERILTSEARERAGWASGISGVGERHGPPEDPGVYTI
jgi:uncharacterized membrane protein